MILDVAQLWTLFVEDQVFSLLDEKVVHQLCLLTIDTFLCFDLILR